MRPNRLIRIGVTLIVGAVVLFGLLLIFGRIGRHTTTENVANDANTITLTGTDNATNPVNNTIVPAPGGHAPAGMVYAAKEDIPERSIITADMLVPVRAGEEQPAGGDAFVTEESTQAEGFITARFIPRNTKLQQRRDLVGHITQVGVAGAILPGRRAMVVPIATKATLHELVHIGDFVDIIASFDQQESRTIVENVRVLAVDIFGKDFPPVKVAMRGNNKAELSTAPPAPTPASSNPFAPPGAQPSPSPAPAAGGPPPPAPEPALTLEVTPDQAVALSLAQASNSPLDFLIHARSEVLVPGPAGAPLPPVRIADVNRAQIAPFAFRYRNKGGAAATGTKTTSATTASIAESTPARGGTRRGGRGSLMNEYGGGNQLPLIPSPSGANGPGGGLNPMPVAQAPRTYEIPIYADGKVVRTDVVRKPEE